MKRYRMKKTLLASIFAFALGGCSATSSVPEIPASEIRAAPREGPSDIGGAKSGNCRVWVRPNYAKAIQESQEAWIVIEYTVAADGSIKDISVVDSSPPGYLEESVISAFARYNKPTDPGREAVEVVGCRVEFRFSIGR
jgi:TonB family protein